jgi:uncharacterized membrane protein YeaQ/YmgE (transglycosylase-associated protein family)
MQQYIIQTVIGMVGGWLSSYLGKGSSYGTIANLAIGALGGNGGSMLLSTLMGGATGAATGGDTSSMVTGALASLVGGGGLTALSSFLPKSGNS